MTVERGVAMTEMAGGARFSGAGALREGYDRSEVDAFVAEVERALADGLGRHTPRVSPEMVRGQRFTPRRFGAAYDMDEVDVFLEEAAAELDRLWQRLGLSSPEIAAGLPLEGPEKETLRWFAAAPRGERFPRSGRLVRGYDTDEVDVVVDRVTTSLLHAQGGQVGRTELEQAVFGSRRDGYDMRTVDEWIDGVVTLLDGPSS